MKIFKTAGRKSKIKPSKVKLDELEKISFRLVEANDEDLYNISSKVNLYIRNLSSDLEVYDEITTKVDFRIYTDARSWGIKEMSVVLHSIGEIEIPILDAETLDEYNPVKVLKINLDLSQLKEEVIKGSIITVGDIDLVIEENGNVNYNDSSIEIYSM